jgi:hypothetical protein
MAPAKINLGQKIFATVVFYPMIFKLILGGIAHNY